MNTVILDDAVVKILIAKSKTDQMGKGRWISIPADVNIFPVRAVRQFLLPRPSCLGQFLFSRNAHHIWVCSNISLHPIRSGLEPPLKQPGHVCRKNA